MGVKLKPECGTEAWEAMRGVPESRRCHGFSIITAHGEVFGKRRCMRVGRFDYQGKPFCRTHRPPVSVAVVEEEVYEDAITYCGCGCGEPVNKWLAVFRTLERDGFSHYKIAAKFDFDRTYVSHLLARPPKYAVGHNAKEQWAKIDPADRGLFHSGLLSLDDRPLNIYPGGDPDRPYSLGEMVSRVEDEPLAVLEAKARTNLLHQLVGDMGHEDIGRIDESELAFIREKLIEEGVRPGLVTRDERERLREPDRHSGDGHLKAPLIPGRKTRRQKIAHKAANRASGNSNRPAQKPQKRWAA